MLDRWMLSRLHATVARATGSLDGYEPFPAATAIAELIDDTSNWYVRRSRRRFWRTDPEADPTDSLGAQATLHEVLVTVARMLAPMTPFLADRMWRDLTGAEESDSVHLADWPAADSDLVDPVWRRAWHWPAASRRSDVPPAPRRASRCASRWPGPSSTFRRAAPCPRRASWRTS